MMNQRSNSEGNIHRFFDEKEKNEKKLSSFLPEFLVRKIAKEETNHENTKQDLFLEDENDEEGLEINMDHYLINEKQNINNNFYMGGMQMQNQPRGVGNHLKKSHSQKQVTQFQDLSDETIDFSQFQNYNPRLNYQQKQNFPNFHLHSPQSYHLNHDNFNFANHQQLINQGYNFNNNQGFQSKNFNTPFQGNNNLNLNNYYNYGQNNFVANNYNNLNNNNFNNNNFNNKFFPRTNSPNINNITNNMNQLNIQNYPANYKNNLMRNNTVNNHTQDQFFNFENHNSDSLNNSTNNSLDDGNFFAIKAPPKKTFSDSNLKLLKNKHENQMKSLFKEKIDSNNDEINLTEILNNSQFDLPEFIKNQKGSRVMQKELNSISPENLELLLRRLCPSLTGIMVDTYGNYFSQKLIQCCSPQQRLLILKSIVKDFVMISCHNSGTHSIQCLMEIINLKEEEEIIKLSIKNDILTLSYDANATHVMQKIIAIVDEKDREYLNIVLLENLLKLVFDANGICVIKRLINGNKDLTIRNKILTLIQKNCLEIIQNPFGNYIIQHILEEWGPEICKDVTKIIHQNIISLSMQKFSSNVVEKCMDLIDEKSRKSWIKDIFNFSKISSLLKNKYGNFVLQKAIMIMSTEEKKEIKEYLIKKIGLISNKEKSRLKGLIDIIN